MTYRAVMDKIRTKKRAVHIFHTADRSVSIRMMDVGDGHSIYVGNEAIRRYPVVVLHGGPPARVAARRSALFLNPEKYHVILFVTGCGRSKARLRQ